MDGALLLDGSHWSSGSLTENRGRWLVAERLVARERLKSVGLKTAALLAGILFVGCSGTEASRPQAGPSSAVREATPPEYSPTPTPEESTPWRKARYISVEEAVRTLQAHVDVPVVLPRDKFAGLPNLKGWLADPKYLKWSRAGGNRIGGLKLLKGHRMLILSYGLAGFDGCGGRDFAIETNVLGQPALVTQASKHLWSHVIWPVTDKGSTGRYGITGTFEGWQMVKFAESMELARLEATEVSRHC